MEIFKVIHCTYRYHHMELIWCLSLVLYLQNNVIMKWTTRFTSFNHVNGWIPLKYGSTTTPSIIAHCQNFRCQASNFTLRSPKTSNISRTVSFDLLPDELLLSVMLNWRPTEKKKYFCTNWWVTYVEICNIIENSNQFYPSLSFIGHSVLP